MIKYLVKIDDEHILYVNEKPVKVKEDKEWESGRGIYPRSFKYKNITLDDSFNISSSKSHLTEILIAIELVKEIKLSEEVKK